MAKRKYETKSHIISKRTQITLNINADTAKLKATNDLQKQFVLRTTLEDFIR